MLGLPQSTEVKRPLPKALAFVGWFEVVAGSSLTEQIRIDQERATFVRQIESLERQMRCLLNN